MDLQKKVADFNATLTYYKVEEIPKSATDISIIGEDGQYTRSHSGYAVINKSNGFAEHTTVLLPGAIFQATHLDNTLKSLLDQPAVDVEALADMPVEDVLAN